MKKKGFTLVELMVVVLIVGILAAIVIPILRGRVESAKWSEAAAIAGTIRTAVKVAYAENPTALSGLVSVPATLTALGFQLADLQGKYFNAGNFTIGAYDAGGSGNATITVTAGTGCVGTGSLSTAAGWVYTAP